MIFVPIALLFVAVVVTVTMNVTVYDFGIKNNNDVIRISIHSRLGYIQK
jgi:hypothetical protein